jgi:hypothetical protein
LVLACVVVDFVVAAFFVVVGPPDPPAPDAQPLPPHPTTAIIKKPRHADSAPMRTVEPMPGY